MIAAIAALMDTLNFAYSTDFDNFVRLAKSASARQRNRFRLQALLPDRQAFLPFRQAFLPVKQFF